MLRTHMEKFVCTHCGNHFEHEPAESLVCPKCFWSTSVKSEKEETATKTVALEPEPSRGTWFWGGGVLFILLLVAVSLFAVRHVKKQDEILQKIETKNAQVIATQAPELALGPEQQAILERVVSLEPQRPLTDQEKEVFGPRFSLRSRGSLGIPTPPWNEKEFETFLKAQEAHFQVSLEWSYWRKLKQLFNQHYLPAAQAFEAKDFLKARDEWIRSLTFPVYGNDIRKHRGVVLTMLRSFVNDTLAKIGTMNASLVGSELYSAEGKVKGAYENLLELLEKQSWEEANAKVLELNGWVADAEKLPKAVAPPPLPKEVAQVDSDIREVLLAQVSPTQSTVPDWDGLRQDLAAKEKAIRGRLPGTLEAASKQYESAVSLIKNKSWQEAREELEKIEYPEEFARDARDKIKVLDQLLHVRADTQKEK